MLPDDPLVFSRDSPVEQVEVADLGRGWALTLACPTDRADPDPYLVACHLLGLLGLAVRPADLARLSPEEMAQVYRFAAAELVHREVESGRLARRAVPACLAWTRRKG